jgi:transcriptional regulator with XRE-family HTH domain
MNGNYSRDSDGKEDIVELGTATPPALLHRLSAVRREHGITRNMVAQRLGVSVEEIRLQEEATDLSVGMLNRWAAALGVPVTELVVEPEEWKHSTHLDRPDAQRLLRMAAKLRERSRRRSVQRLAQTFVEQLTEILPILDPAASRNHRRGSHR